jgi:uncharacterized protein YggT (Ycf19 family)
MKIIGAVINLVLALIELLLGLRFILRLLGALPTSGFVDWIYRNSAPFVEPFTGILPNINFGARSVLELTTLVALIIFGIIAAIVNSLFD